MVRMSALRNCPVILDGKQIGFLQSICMDYAQKKVQALIIACGIRGKRIAMRNDLLSIADGFILIRGTEKYQRSLETKPCTFIRDTSGLLTGKVMDYAIEKENLRVYAIEMQIGYGRTERRQRIWVYDYMRLDGRKNELTIPSCLGSGLIIAEEGNACACQL